MRLNNYLTELAMKAGTKITFTDKTPGKWEIDILVKGTTLFKVGMYRGKAQEVDHFIPNVMNSKAYKKISDTAESEFQYWSIYFTDATGNMSSTGIAEKGVSIELFAALQTVFTDFIKQKKPTHIRFSGRGDSKIKLYKLLAKKISKAIKGQFIEEFGDFFIWK